MSRKNISASERRDRILGVATAAPAMIFLVIFTVYPVFYLIYYSMFSGSLISTKKKFVGLDNYRELWMSETFHKVLVNTVVYTVLFVGLTMVLAVIIAVWLNGSKHKKLNSAVEGFIFTPHVISMVSVSIVFLWLMDPDTGFLNMIITKLGFSKFPFLSSPSTSMFSLVLVMVWKSVGYYVLLIMAALQTVPSSIYEAAELDDTPKIRTFFKITLPMISPTILFTSVVASIASFKIFDSVNVMTQGGPVDSTNTLVYYIYSFAFRYGKPGMACAAGVVLLVLVCIMTYVQFGVGKKKYIISKGREDNMEESTSSIVIRKTGHILNVCLKLCIIVVIAFPFYWMVSTSLKDYTEALQFPPTLFPKTVHWENYTHVFEIVPIGLYFRNSVVVSLLVLVLQYLIIVPAAYSFARHEYFGKNLFFGIVLLGLMIPQQITFLPVYFMFSKMRLLKTFIPLVLPFISNPFGIFMLRQYFMQIPQEVIEAARLDDAGNMKIMFKVMMPMAKPALITIGLLSFISTWNSYFWPLIMTSSETFRTLPVGIAALKSSETLQMWHIIMAGNVVLVIPILLVYMFASKKIRNSFVYSGIK